MSDERRDALGKESDSEPDARGVFLAQEPGRRGEILAAALTVFAEQGYDGGSMREIAARVGVSEPALYRHFPGKEAIFIAMLRVGAGHVCKEVTSLIDEIRPETLRTQMIAVLADRRRAVRFYGPLLRTILPAAASNDRFLEEYRERIVVPVRAHVTQKASEIDDAFRTPDADETRAARVRALMALMVGFIVSSFALGDEPDEVIVDAALRVMGWEDAS